MTSNTRWAMTVEHVDYDDYGDRRYKYYIKLHRDGLEVWTDYYQTLPALADVVRAYREGVEL